MYKYLVEWLNLKTDRRGVTALEYGLIASLVAAAIAGSVATLGTHVSSMFTNIANSV